MKERESVLFIGTQFSILYTSMHSPMDIQRCADLSQSHDPICICICIHTCVYVRECVLFIGT